MARATDDGASLSGSETVLIVEDEPGLLALARKILERQGYTVLVASNADEALETCRRETPIHLVVTDVAMPGGSGPELIERLAGIRPGIRVVYMSGYTEDEIVDSGVVKPGIDFVEKPFTPETLGGKVREVLDREPTEPSGTFPPPQPR